MVVEFNREGHSAYYMSEFLRGIGKRFPDLVIHAYFPEPERIHSLLNVEMSRLEIHSMPWQGGRYLSVLQRIREVFKRWVWVRREVKKLARQSDVADVPVFFMQLDQIVCPGMLSGPISRVLGGFRFGGFYFRHFPFRRELRSLKARLLFEHRGLLSNRNLVSIGLFDENRIPQVTKCSAGRVHWVPDVVAMDPPDDDFPLLDTIGKRAKGRTVVLSIGVQDRRKGILDLLRVAKDSELSSYFFVLAGKFSLSSFGDDERVELEGILNSLPENILIHREFIETEGRFNALIQGSDLIYAVYRNFPFSSNILGKACAFGKPLLVGDQGLMAERVRKYRLGMTIPSGRCDVLKRVLISEEWKEGYSFEGGDQYKADFSMSRFSEACVTMVGDLLPAAV